MEAEKIAHIRELEVLVVKDIKNSNNILEIKKVFEGILLRCEYIIMLEVCVRVFRRFWMEMFIKRLDLLRYIPSGEFR